MADIILRVDGAAGRITLNRPDKLNALTHAMCLEIERALDDWSRDDGVALVLIDAEGDKAFSAGGDLRFMHDAARAGDFAAPRNFWRDEYRLNLKIAEYPKPVVSLMQGFTMGGGVGIGCHASHRVVCETSRLAMPECSIGLIPDVGGTWLLSQAPGHLGEFLALAAERMGPGDAVLAGFADHYLPRERWPDLVKKLSKGTVSAVADLAEPAPQSSLAEDRGWIDSAFALGGTGRILEALDEMEFDAPRKAAAAIRRNAPLSMAASLAMIRNLRSGGGLALALAQEFRFGYRALTLGDLVEGIRARIIDRDESPAWRHGAPGEVPPADVAEMLAPLGEEELKLGRVY
ncbi:enoyl-CoA hydratase/isomerase family protein [Mangrovicoccus sp. HB161399]|uniref:enoyl-CoA hydratase/isomerase family protein n=1 Tax=Mangrovicoccus sp. HB161399 TaxID=2720392 RepID=UPI001551DFEB|nr:enoyl-CoA hydratase/isomerase family protein [Mangrovicoccus sp. HB161399]